MKIWATVDFGHVKVVQDWDYLEGEIGPDSEPHDYLVVFVLAFKKPLAIELTKTFIHVGSDRCYLDTLKIADATILP